jgi:cell pole-organizing protein PopZ
MTKTEHVSTTDDSLLSDNEPTMEELLATIRHVIAGEHEDPLILGADHASIELPAMGNEDTQHPADDDVLELTHILSEGKTNSAQTTQGAEQMPSSFTHTEMHKQTTSEKTGQPTLLSEEVAENTAVAIDRLLAATALSQHEVDTSSNKTTIEEVAIAAMTPYLTTWLNDNLPTLITDIVEREINRLIPEKKS